MSEGNEISRRYEGPGDDTPYVPSWLADEPVCNCGGEPHGKHCALVLNGAVKYDNHAEQFDE